MKILCTGAHGFIGSWLVPELYACGHEVISVDFKDGDLRESGVAMELVAKHEPDVVIHLAAQVGILFNEDDHGRAIESNVTMTLRVAQACGANGARLVHTSTSEVYGDHGEEVVDEDAPLQGRATGIYALTKRWSEDVCREYAPDGLVILRPSMPYGPGAPPGRGRRAMDNMIWQANYNRPIIVHRGSSRSWCWAGDLVRGIRMIVESGEIGAFNVGRDDNEISMLAVAEMACELTGADVSLIREVDPPQRKTMVKRLSTERLRALGWEPKVGLTEGMLQVRDWIVTFDAEGKRINVQDRFEDL